MGGWQRWEVETVRASVGGLRRGGVGWWVGIRQGEGGWMGERMDLIIWENILSQHIIPCLSYYRNILNDP